MALPDELAEVAARLEAPLQAFNALAQRSGLPLDVTAALDRLSAEIAALQRMTTARAHFLVQVGRGLGETMERRAALVMPTRGGT